MIRKFSNTLKKFWNGHKENFLIVEQRNGGYDVTLASRNSEKKEILIRKKRFVDNFRRLRRPILRLDNVVFSLDSRSATTVESVVTLERAQPAETITEAEADQLLYQGFWDFLNRYRTMAAKKMGTTNENLVMAYVQVREVYLGTNRIFNPIGFKANKVSLKLRGTFISRESLSSLERFRKWGDIFVFEKGSVLVWDLPEKNAVLAKIGTDRVSVFKKTDNEQVFVAAEDWGTGSFAKGIAAELGVDEPTAQLIVDRYFTDEVSAHVGRRLEISINGDLRKLSEILEKIKKKAGLNRSGVFFVSRYPLMASAGHSKRFGGIPLRVDEELARREFSLKKGKGAESFDPTADQETLALLDFEYGLPKFEFLNQLLKRRVRWLIPNF